jgi:hypothetical protein
MGNPCPRTIDRKGGEVMNFVFLRVEAVLKKRT